MRLRRIILATVATTLAIAPVMARAAEQGPGYLTSSPEDGEKRSDAPAEVWIMFDMPLDQSSTLHVLDECDTRIDDKDVEVVGNRISVGIAETPSGHYMVHWKVGAPGGVLGEETGTLHFEVTNGEPCGTGGHDGHGSGKKNGGGNGHQGHGGGGGQGGGGHGGGHEGGGGSGGHSGSEGHPGGSGSSGHSSTHTMADGSTMADHEMNGSGHGKGHGRDSEADDEGAAEASSRSIAAAGAPELPAVEGQAVLIALLICMMLGVAGGYVVRVSGRL